MDMSQEQNPVTNWTVLTGGGCSGKSTLADYFGASGYQTIPEGAEQYTELGGSKGYDTDELLRFGGGGPITNFDIWMESQHDPEEEIVLDRSLGDSLAFMDKFLGGAPQQLVDTASERYENVFVLEQLPYEPNERRTDDREFAAEVHEHIQNFYEQELGYDVVEVPQGDLDERAQIIAENSDLEAPEIEPEFPL
jgi:predicted ATPase